MSRYLNEYVKALAYMQQYWKSQRDTKVMGMFPLGAVNVCTKFIGNPSYSLQNISLIVMMFNFMVPPEEETDDHSSSGTSSGDHEIFQPQHQRSVGMMASWLAQIFPDLIGSKPDRTKIYTGPACVWRFHTEEQRQHWSYFKSFYLIVTLQAKSF